MHKPTWLITISLVLLTSLGLSSVAQSNTNDNLQVSKKLQVPTNQRLVFKSTARGAQIYTCQQMSADLSQFEWKLKAPDAKLFDAQGKVVGKHYAGPTWEANDGSKIAAVVTAKEQAPNTSIPWLLLQVNSAEGNGKFSNIKWVQRLNTTGGNSPQDCNRQRLNTEISVPYTADYYFYSSVGRTYRTSN
jgi:FtsP/CotA-like multicopper oxidase with cupredoxin domain